MSKTSPLLLSVIIFFSKVNINCYMTDKGKRKDTAKYEHFVGTLHNYNDHPEQIPTSLHPKFQYLIYGYETTKDGRPHLQAYFQMKYPIRKSTFEKITGAHWWSQPARGSDADNLLYCSKEGKSVSFGERLVKESKHLEDTTPFYIQNFKRNLDLYKVRIMEHIHDTSYKKYNYYLEQSDKVTLPEYYKIVNDFIFEEQYLKYYFSVLAKEENLFFKKNQRDEIEFYFSSIISKPMDPAPNIPPLAELELVDIF